MPARVSRRHEPGGKRLHPREALSAFERRHQPVRAVEVAVVEHQDMRKLEDGGVQVGERDAYRDTFCRHGGTRDADVAQHGRRASRDSLEAAVNEAAGPSELRPELDLTGDRPLEQLPSQSSIEYQVVGQLHGLAHGRTVVKRYRARKLTLAST